MTDKMPSLLNLHGGKVHMDEPEPEEFAPDIKAALTRRSTLTKQLMDDLRDVLDRTNRTIERGGE